MKNTLHKKSFARNFLLATAFAAASASQIAAQQPAGGAPQQQQSSAKGAVIKGRAPVNKEILRVKLPRATEATLSNGLQVVLLENRKVPTFSMQMVVLSGGLSDSQTARGTAQFTASLLSTLR